MIKVKFAANTTPGATPNAGVISSLQTGELIINTADGRMWVKHSNGAIVLVRGQTGDTGPQGPPG